MVYQVVSSAFSQTEKPLYKCWNVNEEADCGFSFNVGINTAVSEVILFPACLCGQNINRHGNTIALLPNFRV
jgi:hypothetical protein